VEELIRLFRRHRAFDELLAAGYLDLGTRPERVRTYGKQVFLGTAGRYLDIHTTHIGQWLRFREVTTPGLHPDLTDDPDIRPVLVDYSDTFLDPHRSLQCTEVTLYLDEEFAEGRVRGVAFRLEDGSSIVLDPATTAGILLAGEARRAGIAGSAGVRAVTIPFG
jgi:hypothetical protein